MTEQQIRKVKKKFILVSTLTFFGVMLLMGSMIYLFSETTLRNEVYQIMSYIIEHDGILPEAEEVRMEHISEEKIERLTERETGGTAGNSGKEAPVSGSMEAGSGKENPGTGVTPGRAGREDFDDHMEWSLKRLFGTGDILDSPSDFLKTTSYFAVIFDDEDEVVKVMTSHISSIEEEDAEHYARVAMRRRADFGSVGRFYYCVADRAQGEGQIVVYIDRTGQLSIIRRILFAVLALLGLGTLLAFFLMRIFSESYLRTEIENAEKQKQFITNASHELKTPLAVIRANTEMQEIMSGETEWTRSTMRQVERMSGLIENLVKIARSQEMQKTDLAPVDLSQVVSETAASYVPVAASEGKKLEKNIEGELVLVTDESVIRQLVSLFLDNAVKYCDPEGTISVLLKRLGRNAYLEISNDFAEGKNVDYSRFFERFYRGDEAHSSGMGVMKETAYGNIRALMDAGPENGSLAGYAPEAGMYADFDGAGKGTASSKGGYGIGLSIAESLVRSLGGNLDVTWKNGRIMFRILLKGGRS